MLDSLHVVAQSEVLNDYPIEDHHPDAKIFRFTAKDGHKPLLQRLQVLEALVTGKRFILFCSIEVARIVKVSFPNLSRGLIFNKDHMRWHHYTSQMPRGLLLNEEYVMLPFGMLYANRHMLEKLFGSRVFFRPDDCVKTFPGLSVGLEDIDRELFGLAQVHHVAPETLTVISKARPLPEFEYRLWLIDGEALSPAGYALDKDGREAPACPPEIVSKAADFARYYESVNNAVVADFAMTEDGAKLVELNCLSTSGFYPQMNAAEVIAALNNILV